MNQLLFQKVLSYAINEAEVESIIHEIETLITGHLHPNLVPKTIIMDTIINLTNLLARHYPNFKLLTKTPNEGYGASDHVAVRKGRYFYVAVKFYITSFKEQMRLYKVLSFDFPISEIRENNILIVNRDSTEVI